MELIKQVLFLLVFIATSLITFYLSGFYLLQKTKTKLDSIETIVLSFSGGLASFTAIALILGFLQLRPFLLPLLLILDIFVIKTYKSAPFALLKTLFTDKLLLTLIVLGIIIQGSINFQSGFLFKNGFDYWSSQGHDGIWHIALMEEIKKEFPPKSPIYSGETLYNYHYLVDVIMGETGRIFPFFSSQDLYFRLFPVLFSFLITTSVFAFVSFWRKNKTVGYWAVFFTTFAGSFGWIVHLKKGLGPLGGETTFWASQLNTIIGNPPHAISISFLLAFLLALGPYLKQKSASWFMICFLLGFLMAGFKVSAGVVLLVGLGLVSIFDLFFRRKIELVLLTAALGISNIIAIKLMTSGATSLLIFLPWWFVRTLIVSSDRLGWMDLELRRQFYLSLHSVKGYLRVGEYEFIAFALFLLGNIGVRFLGLFNFIKEFFSGLKNMFPEKIGGVILFASITAFMIPTLFVQKGIIYNDIEFLQYFILFIGFYSAITTAYLLGKIKKRGVKYLVASLIILLSIPTVLGNVLEFYGPRTYPNALISNAEIQALTYLKDHSDPQSIVLNAPFRQYNSLRDNPHPIPIYAWYSTPYIPALSARTTFLSAEEQALITGYPSKERNKLVEKFFNQTDPSWDKQFLNDNHIKFIYLPKEEMHEILNEKAKENGKQPRERLDEKTNGLLTFYENSEVLIYEVK